MTIRKPAWRPSWARRAGSPDLIVGVPANKHGPSGPHHRRLWPHSGHHHRNDDPSRPPDPPMRPLQRFARIHQRAQLVRDVGRIADALEALAPGGAP